MRTCRNCISYKDGKGSEESCCLVDQQARRRLERQHGTLVDALTVSCFAAMLGWFEASKLSDDCEFYGQHCFYYVEEYQVEDALVG